MKNTLIAISFALLFSGCDNNSNRVEDYKICVDAGMGTKVIGFHSIVCAPPPFQCKQNPSVSMAESPEYTRQQEQEKNETDYCKRKRVKCRRKAACE